MNKSNTLRVPATLHDVIVARAEAKSIRWTVYAVYLLGVGMEVENKKINAVEEPNTATSISEVEEDDEELF